MLTDKDLEEFKKMFRREFKKELTNQEALEKFTALINMVRIVYKPVTQKQLDDVQEFRKQIKARRKKKSSA